MNGETGRNGAPKSGNLIGWVWIILGVVFAGNILDIWDISLLFRGWWTLFIIVPSAMSIMKKGFHSGAGFGLIIGLLLLASQWSFFSIGWIFKLLFPILLILLGLKIVLQGSNFRRRTRDRFPDGYEDEVDCSGFFQSKRVDYPEDAYFGSEANAIFGGAELDLRHALIDEDVTINATAIFGGVDIFLPDDVNVKVSSTGIFGGTDNHIKRPVDPSWPTVYVQSTAVFGGVNIK